MSIRFLFLEEILKLHFNAVQRFGGSLGIREEKLLLSALEMPQAGFGDTYFHENIFEMAAAYAYHISKNHPFVDGNKRTAFAAMDTFLLLNNYEFQMEEDAAYTFIVDIATGMLSDKKEIAKVLEAHCIEIDSNA